MSDEAVLTYRYPPLSAGLDPSPSTSTGSVAEKKPSTKKPAAPPLSSSYSSMRRLKQLAEEVQDPTSVVATLHLLREKMPPPIESR